MRGPSGKRDDNWGRRSRDPVVRWLQARPGRAAKFSLLFTIGMILFWFVLISGVILALFFAFYK